MLWLPVALVLVLLATAAAAYRFELGERLGLAGPDPAEDPAAVAPPAGLDLPDVDPADVAPVAEPVSAADAPRLDPALVRRALAPVLRDGDLGSHVVAAVGDADPGGDGAGDPEDLAAGITSLADAGAAVPASTTKLLTSLAALQTLGPDHVFTTRVVDASPTASPSTSPTATPSSAPSGSGSTARAVRRLVLVGGGDPLLASAPVARGTYPARADVATLARRTAAALRSEGVRRVRLAYDATLFTGPSASPQWEPGYVPGGVVAPVSALWVDRGDAPAGGKVADPAAAAATAYADALAAAGIRVVGAPVAAAAPAGAATLAEVRSAPLVQLVEHTLEVSDNEAAEVLAHQVGLATGDGGSFEGGRRGVLATLRSLGVDTSGDRLYDGSGLSRRNRLTAATLLGVLRLAASPDHPRLRGVLTGLPVGGFTGSLAFRFDTGPSAGRGTVRAKTGTLTGVHGLAGVAYDRSGALAVFVVIADRVPVADTLGARDAVDRAAAALGACRCAATGSPGP